MRMTETTAAPERIQTPYLVPEDELDRSLRPKRLGEFIGQETLREQLAVAIEAASARGDALDHVLLAGPPGLVESLAGRGVFVAPGRAWGDEHHIRVTLRDGPATDRLVAALLG